MLDQTDIEILNLLTNNSRMQWQEIGEKVHLTGQGVKNRIIRMEKLGVIEGYTIKMNYDKIGKGITAIVTIFMKSTDHLGFRRYIINNSIVTEANRISGEGCYMLKLAASSEKEVVEFLDGVLQYGNYRVNLSIEKIK